MRFSTAHKNEYCHAPISLLDPNAVEKAVRLWSDAEKRRQPGATPAALADALLQIQPHDVERRTAPAGNLSDHSVSAGAALGLDLVAIGIHAIGRLIEGGD